MSKKRTHYWLVVDRKTGELERFGTLRVLCSFRTRADARVWRNRRPNQKKRWRVIKVIRA